MLIVTTTESAKYPQMVIKMPMFIFSANLICADPCPSSSIYSGGSCSTVPAGYYLPADMFFGNYYACPAGSYSLSGSSACTPCGSAAYSSVAASACVSCPPGTYFSVGSCAMVPTGLRSVLLMRLFTSYLVLLLYFQDISHRRGRRPRCRYAIQVVVSELRTVCRMTVGAP